MTDPNAAERLTQGDEAPLTNAQALAAAIEQAFDYRGDVTVHTAEGLVAEGYIFDRRKDGPDACVRLMRSDGGGRITILYAQITRLVFTGRDTAEGKSWETWVKKYNESKARGQAANLHPDPLEE